MSRPPVVVVGAGLAGVACARELRSAGVDVRVLDRGRRPGGRMAVRTVGEHAVDVGASYFTLSETAFTEVAHDWQRRALARPWTDTFAVAGPEGVQRTTSGPVRWAATHGLRSLVDDLASGLEVSSEHTVHEVTPTSVDGEPASAVVLAMPDPQARRLLGGQLADVATTDYDPTLVLAAGFEQREWDLDAAFVNDLDLTFVADDGRRRGNDAPVLVAHSTPELARAHLDDPDAAAAAMLASLRRVTGVRAEPLWSFVHRWTFAQPAGTHEQPWHLEGTLGLCGDSWSARPRVEAAFESGRGLGRELAARLAGAAAGSLER